MRFKVSNIFCQRGAGGRGAEDPAPHHAGKGGARCLHRPVNGNHLPPRRIGGFPLVEAMVATALGTLIMAVVASLSIYSARTFSAMSNYRSEEHTSELQSHSFIS